MQGGMNQGGLGVSPRTEKSKVCNNIIKFSLFNMSTTFGENIVCINIILL